MRLMVGDFADAEDAVQGVLLAASKEWPERPPDQPLGWLVSITSRRLIDEAGRTMPGVAATGPHWR